ncbi:type II toxin-antitoxin system VapB family antitoxin [Kitasatospora sp. NPDC057541]|uniref:type II toxin-antitoxin system VapB family antitoxin n=1 Tax=unclassified Kitasatospora TaxID=2633591 RepID=UPI0036CBD7C2
MSVTTTDLDDDALAKALRFSGGATEKDVVNAALREYAERARACCQACPAHAGCRGVGLRGPAAAP